ncbi:hypothetical protein OSTOST_21976 [Ostertagia ostertagi]
MGVPFYGRYWHNVGDAVDPSDDMWRTATASDGQTKFEINYITEHDLGGVMIWAIDFDDDQQTMLSVIKQSDLCQRRRIKKMHTKCSPIDEQRWWTYDDGEVSKVILS